MEVRRINNAPNSLATGITLEPSEVLLFNGTNATGKQVETTLKLVNNSDNYAVFKIKTTRPKAYCVRPNSGCINPHTAQEVKVVMQQMENLAEDGPKHKFQVQTQAVAGPVKLEQVPEVMKKESNVAETKLRCVWENIRLTDGTLYSSPPGGLNAIPRLPTVEEDLQRNNTVTTSTPKPNVAARRPDLPEAQSLPATTASTIKPTAQTPNPASAATAVGPATAAMPVVKNDKLLKTIHSAAGPAGDLALAKGSAISWILVAVAFVLGAAFATVLLK